MHHSHPNSNRDVKNTINRQVTETDAHTHKKHIPIIAILIR